MPRAKANPKPRIRSAAEPKWLEQLGKKVRYTGNPAHKSSPGDFGLTPPAMPRSDKTLCDGAGITQRAEAEQLLREAIAKGMISEQERNGFPQQIWAVSSSGIPLEAQLENQELGSYHGYPLQKTSPLWDLILQSWKIR